jgi:hypothetical protein
MYRKAAGPCLPLSMSLRDLSGRLFGPVIVLPRRPLSKRASTASWSIRRSFRMMISGALSSEALQAGAPRQRRARLGQPARGQHVAPLGEAGHRLRLPRDTDEPAPRPRPGHPRPLRKSVAGEGSDGTRSPIRSPFGLLFVREARRWRRSRSRASSGHRSTACSTSEAPTRTWRRPRAPMSARSAAGYSRSRPGSLDS